MQCVRQRGPSSPHFAEPLSPDRRPGPNPTRTARASGADSPRPSRNGADMPIAPSTGPATTSSDGVATITLNRPEAMNSLDVATKVALRDTVRQAAEDAAVRCVVLTGTGRAFCVGQDLKEHVAAPRATAPATRCSRTVPEHYNPIVTALATMPKPVDRRGQRRRRRAPGRAWPSPATSGSWPTRRRVQPGLRRHRAVLRHRVVVDAAAAGGPGQGASSCSTTRARSRPTRRWSWGWPPRSCRPTTSPTRSAALARQLAAGPTVAYGAIRRSVAYAAAHSFEDVAGVRGAR